MKRIKVLKAYFITWLFVCYIIYANFELFSTFFMATVVFSSAIFGLLAVGTLYQIIAGYDIVMLGGTFGALAYKKTGYEFYLRRIDSILPANIAYMLQSRKQQQKMLFTQEESRSIIEWLEGKFHKQKVYINFFINTSMLIGLLGTFVGLVEAIDHMGQIIIGLNGDAQISEIMQDFAGPISGMAIGFGASLFGVVGAVILGVNGYMLFRYQDTLISGIEEWLKDRIIETVPSGAGGVAAIENQVDLPAGRKSFMDVFVEQIGLLSQEVSNLSKSSGNTETMTEALVAMRGMFEQNQLYMQRLITATEQTNSSLDRILRAQEGLAVSSEDAKVGAQTMLSEHGALLKNTVAVLGELNLNARDITTKMDKTTEAVVSLKDEQISSLNENIGRLLTQIDESFKNQAQVAKDIAKKEEQELYKLRKDSERAAKELVSINESTKALPTFSKKIDERFVKSENEIKGVVEALKNIEKSISHLAAKEDRGSGQGGGDGRVKGFFDSLFGGRQK